jgi:hypothetical protein
VTTTLRWGVWFAAVGFGIAILLTGLAYYQNSHNAHYGLDGLYSVLFPPSLGLMATESAGVVQQIVIVAFVSLENAFLYGLVGLGAGKLWTKIKSTSSAISLH